MKKLAKIKKGQHAGLTSDEVEVPLIIIEI